MDGVDPVGWIGIGRHGCEVDERTRSRLSGVRYAIVPSSPDLLVGVARERISADPQRVMFAGDLGQIPFPDVVSLIAHARKTGVLRVSGADATRTVLFAEGEVRGASSARIGERLCDVIVRMGLLGPTEMEALECEAGAGRPAGRLGVARGLLSDRALWSAVQEHVMSVLQAILLDSSGTFLLTDEPVEDASTVPGLSAAALLMEGVRRIDELRAGGQGEAGRSPARVLAAYNGAFRDIFATAGGAGAADVLRAAAASMLDDDPAHVELFRDLGFAPSGELPERDIVDRALELARQREARPEELLADALSTVTRFLLFVAGEYLDPRVHRALHARVKAIVARD